MRKKRKQRDEKKGGAFLLRTAVKSHSKRGVLKQVWIEIKLPAHIMLLLRN